MYKAPQLFKDITCSYDNKTNLGYMTLHGTGLTEYIQPDKNVDNPQTEYHYWLNSLRTKAVRDKDKSMEEKKSNNTSKKSTEEKKETTEEERIIEEGRKRKQLALLHDDSGINLCDAIHLIGYDSTLKVLAEKNPQMPLDNIQHLITSGLSNDDIKYYLSKEKVPDNNCPQKTSDFRYMHYLFKDLFFKKLNTSGYVSDDKLKQNETKDREYYYSDDESDDETKDYSYLTNMMSDITEANTDALFAWIDKLRWCDRDERIMNINVKPTITKVNLIRHYSTMKNLAEQLKTTIDSKTGVFSDMDDKTAYNFLFHIIGKGQNFYHAAILEPSMVLYLLPNGYQNLYDFMSTWCGIQL